MTDPFTSTSGEVRLHQHAVELLGIHEALVTDGVRNRAFREALERHVTPESSVLDIGSGTGLWAILAAKLGAGRVVAIERDPMMCGAIMALAHANGVGNRVQVIEGDSLRADPGGGFDVVVSETIGHMIFDEQVVEIMADARKRFLKPGGVLIPERVALRAAPVSSIEPRDVWPVEIAADFRLFQSLALHRPVAFLDTSGFQQLAPAITLVETDLTTVHGTPDVGHLAAAWDLSKTDDLEGILVWAEMRLTEDITLSTLDTSSWSATLYRLGRFSAGSGELRFILELSAHTNRWTATLVGETQRFSPAEAATQLMLLRQTGGVPLSHLQPHAAASPV